MYIYLRPNTTLIYNSKCYN